MNTTLPCLADSGEAIIDIGDFSISVSPEQTILIGNSVQIFANGPSGTNFKWSPAAGLSDPNISNPVASPLQDAVYKVKATDNDDCISEDSVKIKVIRFNDFYLPIAFTPNGDGKNDMIRPFYHGKYNLLEFSVFNRWGERVFTTSTRGEGWNGCFKGNLQPIGVYVWIIKAVHQFEKPVEIKGTFVLVR